MLQIGIVGADNFHALAFSKLANLPPERGGCGLPARVKCIWGETVERARFVAEQAEIPCIVNEPAEMLGQVDAVMVVLRRGSQHFQAAAPFIKAGIPTWVDKPLTCDPREAQELTELAQKSGTLLAGGSACKYGPDVLRIRQEYHRLKKEGQVISAHLNFPGELDSPYDGLYFYGAHTAEILRTVFGPDVQSVKADVTAGNVIAVFKYPDMAVSVDFAEVSQFSCTLYSPQQVVSIPIDISTIFRPAFESFVNGVMQNQAPESFGEMLRPVMILDALVKAAQSGLETFVQASV